MKSRKYCKVKGCLRVLASQNKSGWCRFHRPQPKRKPSQHTKMLVTHYNKALRLLRDKHPGEFTEIYENLKNNPNEIQIKPLP